MKSLTVALIGVTGMVGRTMLKVLEQREFPVEKLVPVASAKSIGTTIDFNGDSVEVVGIETALGMYLDLALFSAGCAISTKWVPKFASNGVVVVDNSSAFRLSENYKLVIPEINGAVLTEEDMIIANPNCTTMQLLMALKPLHDLYNIERGVVNTYQSVTGTGAAALNQLDNIDMNCLPHCGEFQENGYTREEMKVHHETKKIMGDSIQLSCTAVRVPVDGGHSEAVYLEFSKDFELGDVRNALSKFPGVIVEDDPSNNVYPMPLNAKDRDEVFVGRIRRDLSNPRALHLWIVSDNLRKGAATNTIQIAEYLNLNGRWS